MGGVVGRLDLRRKAAIMGPALVILVLTGPFGTYETLGFLPRAAYWALALLGCGVMFHLAMDAALHLLPGARAPAVLRLALAALLAALPASALIVGLETGLRAGVEPQTYPYLYLSVAAIGFLFGVLYFLAP